MGQRLAVEKLILPKFSLYGWKNVFYSKLRSENLDLEGECQVV